MKFVIKYKIKSLENKFSVVNTVRKCTENENSHITLVEYSALKQHSQSSSLLTSHYSEHSSKLTEVNPGEFIYLIISHNPYLEKPHLTKQQQMDMMHDSVRQNLKKK